MITIKLSTDKALELSFILYTLQRKNGVEGKKELKELERKITSALSSQEKPEKIIDLINKSRKQT